MKICIYGAGAVGGHLAARLAKGGGDISLVARGAQLTAIQRYGLRVRTPEGELHSFPVVTDSPSTLGVQDVVIVSVKAPALKEIVGGLAHLVGAATKVIFVLNGIPWWYCHGQEMPGADSQLSTLDPDQLLWKLTGSECVVGAVAYTACTVIEPGVINVANPQNRLVLGRPDGKSDERLEHIAGILKDGGIEVEVTPNIRDAIWGKLLMNITGGTLAILSGSAMKFALDSPEVMLLAKEMMSEAAAIARGLGCNPGDPLKGLPKLAVSQHKQSILQDLEQARTMEIDAMLRVPLELARTAGVATPALDVMIALATQRARSAGLYQD